MMQRTMLELVETPRPRTVRTAGGRGTGYYEYGDPDGRPVIALHGTPACGAGFAWADGRARSRAIRLLAPDRPGVGDSDPWSPGEGTTVAEYAPALESFADALDLTTFSVVGYSGGGPYALAAAHALRERIPAAAVVSGAGQVGVWASVRDFETTDWLLTKLANRVPLVANMILTASAHAANLAPRTSLRFAKFEMSRADHAVMAQFPSARAALAVFSQSCRRGARGVVDDYVALGRPWGFAVEEITIPVRCWHATADPIVPLGHSEELVRRVPYAQLSEWDDEGHLAIVDHIGEVFDDLTRYPERQRS
jgi:pimeloyl-ACP methyl ester carboxylesterase